MAINPSILERLADNDPTVVGLNLTQEVESDADVEALVKALEHNTYFKSLSIQGRPDGKNITDRSAAFLASCHHLVFLDISYNKNITNIGAAALAKNLSIETLFMRGCSVTPAGLEPFLEHPVITDLRIAMTSARSEQVYESIQVKLEENELRKKRERRWVDQLNDEFYKFIQENPAAIKKLVLPVQEMAAKDFRYQPEVITTALILCHHLSKLEWRIAEKAMDFAHQYQALREANTKKRKEDSPPLRSSSLSPSI